MKPLGPVHAYVAPATDGVVKLIVVPAHNGLLLPAVGVGNALMVTLVVVVAEHPFPSVTMTV